MMVKEVNTQNSARVITTWWVNRLAGYLVILPLVFVAAREALRGNLPNAINLALWTAALLVLFETLFFRARITISDRALTFRRYPWPIGQVKTIQSDDVHGFEHLYYGKVQTATVVVQTKGSSITLPLASFSRPAVKDVTDWLRQRAAESKR